MSEFVPLCPLYAFMVCSGYVQLFMWTTEAFVCEVNSCGLGDRRSMPGKSLQ